MTTSSSPSPSLDVNATSAIAKPQAASATTARPQDVEAFGELGPVLIFTFVLWLAIMVVVGITV